MAELVDDCPRCGANKITFDVLSDNCVRVSYEWQRWFETFCVCRRCHKATVFVLSQKEPDMRNSGEFASVAKVNGVVNDAFAVQGFINLKDLAATAPPEHLPPSIDAAFKEGATCRAVGCYNAAGVMFRLCVDLTTAPLLPATDTNGLNSKIRRDLGLRLPWLFTNKLLAEDLHELSKCVKDDGNDGAHKGTLGKEEAEDLQDFTVALLERRYTEPAKLKEAADRRNQRRTKPTK